MGSEWVPPEHREIHEFLLHWGRWNRSHPIRGHAASIEHRYRSPQCWYPPDPRPEEADSLKAQLIERQMRIIQATPRRILKFKYVYRADREWISRRLRFHVERYEQSLYTARQIVLNLTRAQIWPTSHGKLHKLHHLRLSGHAESTP